MQNTNLAWAAPSAGCEGDVSAATLAGMAVEAWGVPTLEHLLSWFFEAMSAKIVGNLQQVDESFWDALFEAFEFEEDRAEG